MTEFKLKKTESTKHKNKAYSSHLTTDFSSSNDNEYKNNIKQNESITKLQDECSKLTLLLDDKMKDIQNMKKEILNLNQRIFSLEDEQSNALLNNNEVLNKYSEILSTFQQKLELNYQRIVQNSVENIYQSSNIEISQLIETKSNEIVSALNLDTFKKQNIKYYFDEINLNIKSIIEENFKNNNFINESLQAIFTSIIRKEFTNFKEENENFVKKVEKIKQEKNDLISSLDKEITKVNAELISKSKSIDLYKSKFENARLVLKNIFSCYLDQEFFNQDLEKCFANDDLYLDDISELTKAIKVNFIIKIFDYILNDVIKEKIVNKKSFENINKELSSLDFNFQCKTDLYKFTEHIKIDETNILNRIFAQILKHCDEKSFECQILTDKNIHNKYQIVNLSKEKEELLKTINHLKDKVNTETSKHFETHNSTNDLESNLVPIQVLSERNEWLEQENKKLIDQKMIIKKHTKEVLIKVQNEIKDVEYMVDRRIIINFLLKALDKKANKKLRKSIKNTLANFLDLTNDERLKIGLNTIDANKLNTSCYNTYNPSSTTTEKVREYSDNLYNFILNA